MRPRLGRLAVVLASVGAAGCLLVTSLDGYTGGAPSTPDATAPADAPTVPTPDAAPDIQPDAAPTDRSARYRAAVLADEPIAYYRLSDVPPATSSRGEVDGGFELVYGEVTPGGAEGLFGPSGDPATHVKTTSLALDGPAGSATFDFPGNVPFTFELWIRLDPPAGAGSVLLNLTPGPGTGAHLFLQATGTARWERWISGELWRYALGGAPVGSTRFHHVVVTFDGNKDLVYVDRLTGEGYRVSDGGAGWPTNAKPFTFGGPNAVVDELAVYDRALSEARIRAHYAAATDP